MRFTELSQRAKAALVLLMLLSTVALLGAIELAVRASGAETDLVPHANVEISIPAWLATDTNFAPGGPHPMKAAEVVWLRHFTEARYMRTKLKPGISVDAVNPYNRIELAKGITFRFSSNGDGFRGRAFTPSRSGVRRVAAIGDSSTFGWGVDDAYTYPHLLEARLNRTGAPPTEVFNLGIPGFTSRHGLAVLRHHALPLSPDVVIISFGANDPRLQRRSAHDVLSEDDGWRGAVRHAALRSKAYRLLRKVSYDAGTPPEVAPSSLVPAVSDGQYVANLRSMIRTVRNSGAQPVLLAVCANESIVGQMREVGRRLEVPMVDALPLLMDRQDDLRAYRLYADEVRYYEGLYGADVMARSDHLYVTTDGCHPNRAGMSIIADALEEAVAKGQK